MYPRFPGHKWYWALVSWLSCFSTFTAALMILKIPQLSSQSSIMTVIMTVIISTSNKSTGCLPLANIDGSTTFHCSGRMVPKGDFKPSIPSAMASLQAKLFLWNTAGANRKGLAAARLKISQLASEGFTSLGNKGFDFVVGQNVDQFREGFWVWFFSPNKFTCGVLS